MGPIMLVEDPVVQKFLHSVLLRRGYQVLEAVPHTALNLIKAGSVVSLVITNDPSLFLPYAEHVRLLYIAACPDPGLALRFRNCRVLQKPFHPSDLLENVRDLVASDVT